MKTLLALPFRVMALFFGIIGLFFLGLFKLFDLIVEEIQEM